MTQEEFDKAPLLDQILYDETGMLVENHPSIAKAMEKYHQAKLKLLGIGGVVSSADYKHIWKLMDELNTIMWESYMIKGKDFGRQEGYKIMGLLEQWAERH